AHAGNPQRDASRWAQLAAYAGRPGTLSAPHRL
ncbi:MAG: hypothetical protein AVDCRST_MAG43-1283, partial [uncultured Thermomicrobiales bacterium]